MLNTLTPNFSVEEKMASLDYFSTPEIIGDIRLIFENCYRYNGTETWISKLACKVGVLGWSNFISSILALNVRSNCFDISCTVGTALLQLGRRHDLNILQVYTMYCIHPDQRAPFLPRNQITGNHAISVKAACVESTSNLRTYVRFDRAVAVNSLQISLFSGGNELGTADNPSTLLHEGEMCISWN